MFAHTLDTAHSNKEWTHPYDPDARITKMKDRRTHLAHKAEHAVDLDTGAIVAVTVQGADRGDTTTGPETLAEAVDQLEAAMDRVLGLAPSAVWPSYVGSVRGIQDCDLTWSILGGAGV
jgi:hypothetical protein